MSEIKKKPKKSTTDSQKGKKQTNTKKITRDFALEKAEQRNRKFVMLALIAVLTLVFLFFLLNKTFFRTQYKNGSFQMELPVFSYFYGDESNVATFKSLRKEESLQQYFDEYLSNLNDFDYYVCSNGTTFYYNAATKNIIYDVAVKSNGILQTIQVFYDVGSYSKICI